MTTLFIRWNATPEIISLFNGGLQIRWYGLFFALAFLLGYYIFMFIAKREKIAVTLIDNLTLYVAIGTILGARLGHCLFYEPEYYLKNPLEILFVWHGGLASHGGAIGVIIALYLLSKKYKISNVWLLDRISIAVALAAFFIRMGNLMNSEIYGVATTLPWGFVFIRNGEMLPKHPTQIYEGLAYLIIFFVLCLLYLRCSKLPRPGLLLGIFLVSVFSARFVIEFIKEPQVAFETTMIINMGQLLSIPFIIAGVIILWRMPAKHSTVDSN